MLFLARCCKVNTYAQYSSAKNALKIFYQSHVRLLLNLKTCNALHNNAFDSVQEELYDNPNVKKLLDYMVNEFVNNNWKKSNLNEVLDFGIASALLSTRSEIIKNVTGLSELLKDSEMKDLAREEERAYNEHLRELDRELVDTILKNLGNNTCDKVVLEVTAGVGGQEAMLFAKELFGMYIGYANYLGYATDILEEAYSDLGGIRKASMLITGAGALNKTRYEAGVHRVQRTPHTEKSGRVHTSVVSVAILPELTDVEVSLNPRDLKIDTMKASGAGGQFVNTTDSAVRVTHIPTGIAVTNQTDRSQIKNRGIALIKLKNILYEHQINKQVSVQNELRKKQMGMGNRNEKVRTYNFYQDRVTDHRISHGTVHNLREFMEGGAALAKMEEALSRSMQVRMLVSLVDSMIHTLK